MSNLKKDTILKCGKCENGTVFRRLYFFDDGVTVYIGKCTGCSYQYGIKELEKSQLEIIEQ